MAARTKSKDKVLNMVYSLGASIVIIGALFKINHYSIGPLDGSIVLAIGLIIEAFIFIVFAFDPPAGEYDWERAYPELTDGKPVERKVKAKIEEEEEPTVKEAQVSLSEKLDNMLSQAKLDVSLFEKLRGGIENFGVAVGEINKTTEANTATEKYKDQMYLAASHMENLNALYQLQLAEGRRYSEVNQKFVSDIEKAGQNSVEFQKQITELTANLNNLNKVYGGMLNAMKS